MRLRDYLEDYLIDAQDERGSGAKTLKWRRGILRNFFDWLGDGALSYHNCRRYVRYLRAKGNDPYTINRYVGVVKSFARFLTDIEKVDNFSEIYSLRRLPEHDKEVVTWTIEEVRAIVYCRGRNYYGLSEMWRLLFMTMYSLALRRVDVSRLRVRDLVKEEDGYYLLIHGKGNRIDRLYVLPRLARLLVEYIDWRKQVGEDWIFKNRFGNAISSDACNDELRARQELLGMNPIRASHTFRRSRLTHMALKKASVWEIMKQSRHRKLATVQRYIDRSGIESKKVAMRYRPDV